MNELWITSRWKWSSASDWLRLILFRFTYFYCDCEISALISRVNPYPRLLLMITNCIMWRRSRRVCPTWQWHLQQLSVWARGELIFGGGSQNAEGHLHFRFPSVRALDQRKPQKERVRIVVRAVVMAFTTLLFSFMLFCWFGLVWFWGIK